MQQILLGMTAPEMVLAKDVKDAGGRILCGKGTVLTTNIISRLKKMEIAKVTVEGHPLQMGEEKSLEEEIASIEERFVHVKRIPPLMAIKQILIDRATQARSE